MIKIFETGDLHIGRAYNKKEKHPEGKALAEKRVEAITGMVAEANREKCDLFAVTGDLFDKLDKVGKKRIAAVVDALSGFAGTVLVLPGNHDNYPGDELPEVWSQFLDASGKYDNIVLLTAFEPYEVEIGDENVVVYPAFCQTTTAPENNLGWIKELEIPADGTYRIGMAHGAVAGYTIDTEDMYFLMTEEELNAIPMDIWLIGHTHVMFPKDLTTEYKMTSSKVFNAGTHVQTDVNNNTEGNCFVFRLEKDASGKTELQARRFISGNVFFKHFDITVQPNGSGTELRDAIQKAVAGVKQNTSVALTISGTVTREEYEQRESIYADCLGGFFEYSHPEDKDLTELIDEAFIKSEFSELTFPAKLLLKLVDDPRKTQMAYELLTSDECKV